MTEADWQRWTEIDLHPYLEICLEAFGLPRCLAGSDWPGCLVATSYPKWWQLLKRWLQLCSPVEPKETLGGTAASFYTPKSILSFPTGVQTP